MSKFKIAVIEDDEWFAETIKYYLELNEDNKITVFNSAESFFKNNKPFEVICVDFHLPGMYGDEVVTKLKEKNPDQDIIVVSAQEDMQITVDLLKMGVKDYIIKSEHAKELIWKAIEEVKEKTSLKKKIVKLEKKLAHQNKVSKIELIGEHSSIKAVKKLIHKAAESDINVSITGDTGTGKEVVAQQIHDLSQRSSEAFVAVNMGAIPNDLVESELFGYEKGAFTGAMKSNKGKFELANGGTLFLDEIAELDLNLQAKLLRALQEKEITPLGSEKSKKLNIRLIVASHKDLAREVEKGNFREDLFFRIIGLPINLPRLKDRGNDLFLLSEYFLNKHSSGKDSPTIELSKKAKQKLMEHPFPGNIRELKSVIDLAAVLAENNLIEENDIKFNHITKDNSLFSEDLTLKEFNEKIILHYLKKHENNVLKTAQSLDIGKSTIYNLLNRKNESSNI